MKIIIMIDAIFPLGLISVPQGWYEMTFDYM